MSSDNKLPSLGGSKAAEQTFQTFISGKTEKNMWYVYIYTYICLYDICIYIYICDIDKYIYI